MLLSALGFQSWGECCIQYIPKQSLAYVVFSGRSKMSGSGSTPTKPVPQLLEEGESRKSQVLVRLLF